MFFNSLIHSVQIFHIERGKGVTSGESEWLDIESFIAK